jgi:hypothetical protein
VVLGLCLARSARQPHHRDPDRGDVYGERRRHQGLLGINSGSGVTIAVVSLDIAGTINFARLEVTGP